MDCPACGAPNEDDALFCGSCGTTLNLNAPKTTPHPEAAPTVVEGRGTVHPVAAATLPTSGMAIASLVLGIAGLTFLPLLGSIVAAILGGMARGDIRRRPDEVAGDGVALVGLVLGWIGIGLSVLGLLLFGAIAVCALIGAFGAAWPAG